MEGQQSGVYESAVVVIYQVSSVVLAPSCGGEELCVRVKQMKCVLWPGVRLMYGDAHLAQRVVGGVHPDGLGYGAKLSDDLYIAVIALMEQRGVRYCDEVFLVQFVYLPGRPHERRPCLVYSLEFAEEIGSVIHFEGVCQFHWSLGFISAFL